MPAWLVAMIESAVIGVVRDLLAHHGAAVPPGPPPAVEIVRLVPAAPLQSVERQTTL